MDIEDREKNNDPHDRPAEEPVAVAFPDRDHLAIRRGHRQCGIRGRLPFGIAEKKQNEKNGQRQRHGQKGRKRKGEQPQPPG